MNTRSLTPLDEAFGLDQAALDTVRLRTPGFPLGERRRRRAEGRRQRVARRRNRA